MLRRHNSVERYTVGRLAQWAGIQNRLQIGRDFRIDQQFVQLQRCGTANIVREAAVEEVQNQIERFGAIDGIFQPVANR